MYTVSKGPSKIVAKTRLGLTQNYEKFETIKESGKRSDKKSPENMHVPRPVFHPSKKIVSPPKQVEEEEKEAISPQQEEIVKYISDTWNSIAQSYDPSYDVEVNTSIDPNNNSASCSKDIVSVSSASSASSECISPTVTPPPIAPNVVYYNEPLSPDLKDFKPFDLEAWWGRRVFNNITKSL